MDRLPAHLSAVNFFEREHPDWFIFEYLPSYTPEWNPVEQMLESDEERSLGEFRAVLY